MAEVNFLPSTHRITYAIDASSANKEKRTGVENYAFQLIEAMKQQPLLEGERVVLFSPTVLTGALAILPSGWESRVLGWKLKRGWMQGRISWELFRRPPQIFFVPAQGLPFFVGGARVVTTIHDIGFHRMGKLYDPVVRKRIASATKCAIKKTNHLLTVSQFTKDELQTVFHVTEERMTVTPLAADTTCFRKWETREIDEVLRKHRLGQNFFLFVGRLEKKKNVTTLIRAFELFKQTRGIGDPFELVLVGEPGFGYEEIKQYITLSAQKEFIRETGYLPDGEVAALMNRASAFLFPSWYEGFGIPLLEAMACGTIVMASDIVVHHEVIKDAGIFITTDASEEWAKEMKRMVDDTVFRDMMIKKSFLRVADFSWTRTAQQTWNVLRSLI